MGLLRTLIGVSVTIGHRFSSSQSVKMKYLNVAEKNDAAKNIAALLSRGNSNRREGRSHYNKIYEFDAVVFGHPARMAMTSVSGHLLNYQFTMPFRKWENCSPLALFDAPIFKTCLPDYQAIKETLEREIRSCQGLIIWTDCDREGENIGFEVIKVCTDIKPNIPVYRAKFSEITAASIFRALNNLGQPNKNVSDAVDVRQELDLRTGAAFTRLQTLRLQRVFPRQLADKLISYGSCQFPTLGFVVERYQAIESFVAEPFWRIKMNHKIKDLTVDYNWKRDRLFEKRACEALLDICKENPLATVELVESKPKNKWRPLPLDTVELEKTVSRKLRINAKDTMKIAERLYTQGFISYPRTETNIFPKELDLVPLVQQQCADNRWGPFAQGILDSGGPNPRQGRKSDQAHPPIHPTKYANGLAGNEQRIYEYVVRHFLACVSKDALGHETAVHVDIADEKFVAKGLLILERNYLEVYVYDKWNAKEIHEYRTGDTFTPTELSLFESTTSPPKLLTEADLITLMEKHGIGTDATHAEHIDKIKSREYVGLHENIYFVPGTLGMGLVEGYNNIGLEVSLAKPVLRADFENDLKLICDGLRSADVVRREQTHKYKLLFQTVMEKMNELDRTLAHRLEDQPEQVADDGGVNAETFKPVLKCPKCGNDMIVRTRKSGVGKYLGCCGYPACRNAVWLPLCAETVEVLDESCQNCGGDVKKLKMKFKQNPFPGEPNPNIVCIGGCDNVVLETLEINYSSVRRTNQNRPTQQQPVNNWFNAVNRTANPNPPARPNFPRPPNDPNRFDGSRRDSGGSSDRRDDGSGGGGRGGGAVAVARSANRLPRSFLNGSSAGNGGLMPPPNRNPSRGSLDAGPSGSASCNCGAEAVLLTVRKEGPNTGRQFYKCQKGLDNGGCNFFQWADVPSLSNVRNADQPGRSNSGPNSVGTVMCNCNIPAAQRRVTKEGANKGREFYCCPKPVGEGCRFFKWSDEVDNSVANGGDNDDDDHWGGGGESSQGWNGSSQGWNGNTSRWSGGSGSPWKRKKWKRPRKKKTVAKTKTMPYKAAGNPSQSKKSKAARKCGVCGQEGHTKVKCPNK